MKRWFYNFELRCYEGTHLYILLLCTIPAIIFYLILIPLFLFCKLRQNKQLIENFHHFESFSRVDQYKMIQFMSKYGFLVAGVKLEMYAFDLYYLTQKALIIMVT